MDSDQPNSNLLQHALAQLQALLMRTPRVDEGSKRRLREALDDVERLLGSGAGVAPAGSRLQALAVDFEAEHPSLAAGVREFVELLGQAGL
jgi:hypothetical protein